MTASLTPTRADLIHELHRLAVRIRALARVAPEQRERAADLVLEAARELRVGR